MSRSVPTLKEIYALELINTYLDQFGDLTLSDKPDIIAKDHSVGIEVTSGLSESDEKALSFEGQLNHHRTPIERKKKLVGWLNTYDKYKHNLPSFYLDDNYISLLFQRIEKKRSKIKNYQFTNKLGLFVTTEIINNPQKSLYEYIRIFEANQDVFDFLILDIHNWAYVICIDRKTRKVFNYYNRRNEILSITRIKAEQNK